MFNGVTLGSTYALIAIGYTMVLRHYRHDQLRPRRGLCMIGSCLLMIIAALMMMGIDTSWLLVAAGFVGAIVIASAYGWSIERVAYRRCAAQTPDCADLRHRDVHLPAKLRQPDRRFSARCGAAEPV